MSKIQLIHITVIKYNTLRSNAHSKIHKNGNTAQNVITHTLCQNITTHSDHCRTTDSDRIGYTLHHRSVYKNYADLSLVISALNRLDRRSIPRIVDVLIANVLTVWQINATR